MTIFDRPNECRFDCASPWIVNQFEQSAFGNHQHSPIERSSIGIA